MGFTRKVLVTVLVSSVLIIRLFEFFDLALIGF